MSQRQIIEERQVASLAKAALVFFLLAAVLSVVSVVLQQIFWAQSQAIFNEELDGGEASFEALEQQLDVLARRNALVTGLKALGLAAVASGVLAFPRGAGSRRKALAGAVAALFTAVAFIAIELSALVTHTSPVHEVMEESTLVNRMLMLGCMVGLVVAALCWRRVLLPATICCYVLLGSTVLGSFLGSMLFTPLLMTFAPDEFISAQPWILLVSTAGAALAALCAAGTVVRASRDSG